MSSTPYSEKEEIRVTGVNPDLKKQIDNIASNMGIPTAVYIRLKIREIVDATPDKMKEPQKN